LCQKIWQTKLALFQLHLVYCDGKLLGMALTPISPSMFSPQKDAFHCWQCVHPTATNRSFKGIIGKSSQFLHYCNINMRWNIGNSKYSS
jgi:hypothetical protein